MYAHVTLMPCRWSPSPLVAPEPFWYSVVVFPSIYSIALPIPIVNIFLKKNKYFFKFFLIFFRAGTLTGCGFVAVEKQNRENTFFAEGRSAVAGILTPVFSDRHQDQRKKKSKKEKKRTKRKEKIYYLYLF
jgi:hypothetical protein